MMRRIGPLPVIAFALATWLVGCKPERKAPEPAVPQPAPEAVRATLQRYHHALANLKTCEYPAQFASLTRALLDGARRSSSVEIRRIVETTGVPRLRLICPTGPDIATRDFLVSAEALADIVRHIGRRPDQSSAAGSPAGISAGARSQSSDGVN